jgi:hypothetical protein
MMRKAALLVGLAAGYVLGARDGRERYEQIKGTVTGLAQDPRVQAQASKAAGLARDKAPGSSDGASSRPSTPSSTPSSTVSDAELDTPIPTTLDALDEEIVVVPSGPIAMDGGHDV